MIIDLLAPLFKVLEKAVPDADLREKLRSQITMAALENEKEYVSNIKDIVVAEAQGESWMQRNWRPAFSFMLMGTWAWSFILRPVVSAAFGVDIEAVPADQLTFVTSIWAGAYGIGRTFEKTGSTIKIGGA